MGARLRFLSALLPVFLLLPSFLSANALRDIPLSQKVAKADIVVLGRTLSISRSGRRFEAQYAMIRVERILKGAAPPKISVMAKGTISELDPDCCVKGQRYLFFLQEMKNGSYASVDGRFGIVPLDSALPLGIPDTKGCTIVLRRSCQ